VQNRLVLHFFFGCFVASKIHSYREIPSTNRVAFELAAAGAAHGEIVLAKSQTAGRGRLGKAWTSPEGKGLYFSIIVRPDLLKVDYPKLTIDHRAGDCICPG
jgi:BirA family biotin operon repressor/biotin-[acetyl-CoA-carboxylase] ligase